MRITAIYDNGGRTLDRYTVLTDVEVVNAHNNDAIYMALGLNTGGQGYSQWGEATPGNHLGRQIHIEDLDELTQKHIAGRIFQDV